MIKLILIILGVLIALISENHLLIFTLVIGSLLFILVNQRANANVFHLCICFITVKIIEMIVFKNIIVPMYSSETMSSMWMNVITFTTHLVTDLFLYCFVLFRAPLSRAILLARNKSIDSIYMYQSEFAFLSLFFVFILIDLAAILESFIRHLDEVGFSLDIAEKFANWTWVYYHYSDIKSVLAGLSFILIWSMISKIGQQEYTATLP
jgi:hypothetical protein